jgi:hypothetical protein
MKTWDAKKRKFVPVKWSKPDALGYVYAAILFPSTSMKIIDKGINVGAIS